MKRQEAAAISGKLSHGMKDQYGEISPQSGQAQLLASSKRDHTGVPVWVKLTLTKVLKTTVQKD